jgi:hypothetical protein
VILPSVDAARATVVIVGGHEGGGEVSLEPLAELGLLLRAASPDELPDAVHQAAESADLPVCVVPMTLGRDPELVAGVARKLRGLTAGSDTGRIVLADAFADATLLTGWLRVAVNQAAAPLDATNLAALLTANAANRYDDAELFRIAHLVKEQVDVPWVEVAFHGGDPDVAEGVDRCRNLGADQVVAIPADFGPAMDAPTAGLLDGGPLLSPAAISGMLATRVDTAILKLSRGDDGIAGGLDADHEHGHGGTPWHEPDAEVS